MTNEKKDSVIIQIFPQTVLFQKPYTQSYIISDEAGSHVFRGSISQFLADFHEILQTLSLFFKS